MAEFNKKMTDDEFLEELNQMDTGDLIEAFNEVNLDSYEIQNASELIEMLSCGDDVRYLLELQSSLPDKILCDYEYILTGTYYSDTDASDDIHELLDETFREGWLEFKDELIEYFTEE